MEKAIVVNGKEVKVEPKPGSIWALEFKAILSTRAGLHVTGRVWHTRRKRNGKVRKLSASEVMYENWKRGLAPLPFTTV